MAVFADINKFMESLRYDVESTMKREILPALKEKAQEIVIGKIYSVYSPKIYKRAYELIDAFMVECKWEGDTCVGILKVKSDMHGDNSTWKGDKYSLDEIINEYFVRGGWGNGSPREGVDTLGETERDIIETGLALELLLNELKKHFDIS